MATTNPYQSPQSDYKSPEPGGPSSGTIPGAHAALGLLWAINLFNYIDRQVLAGVEPEIRQSFFPQAPEGAAARAWSGSLALAFLISYMLTAPLFGAMAARFPRWKLIAVGVIVWSLATGAGGIDWGLARGGGLAGAFLALLLTRCFVGVGEGAYGPLAPTILSDYFPVAKRGKILSLFYVAMPVGGALGYALGDFVAKLDKPHESWRWAFLVLVIPGLALGIVSLFMRESPTGAADAVSTQRRMTWQDYRILLQTPSFVLNTLGMTAMSFGMGALAYWMPDYLEAHQVPGLFGQGARTVFGFIVALAGLVGTIAGGMLGDRLRGRWRGSYFLVSGVGLLLSGLFVVLFLVSPFPTAWWMIFAAVFFIFLNTGPTNAILANVVHPVMRPAGFALNILVIHILGDAISPLIVGAVSGYWSISAGFGVVSAFLALGGLLWLWGAKHLEQDTELAPKRMV
jgi:MFS transporter, Spinster family, sphingosine-1-phosphate transporter